MLKKSESYGKKYIYHFVYHNYHSFCFHLYHFVECPNITFKNSWYIFPMEGGSWDLNRDICQSQGGDLVSIETEEEWNFINDEIQRRNNTHYINRWSIGLSKKAGNWTWVSVRPLTICKWGKGEPSGEHNAAFMYKRSSNGERGVFGSCDRGSWENRPAYICEISKGRLFLFCCCCCYFVFLFFFHIVLSKCLTLDLVSRGRL